ncbi:NADPH-dependent F420 reductase [Afifella pfennigii]|uniref:NADPH-dependent F420 reductase n=1 Tax=Afifella pfennigii TaxID=209897 RepID=UPI00047C9742|nr:NADPH-dependent F420 reductase [Afifella pfennigii]
MSGAPSLLAVLGGTGALGGGLAIRAARAGIPVIIGSRTKEKGEQAAAAIKAEVPEADVRGTDNAEAAATGEMVVVTVPFAHQADTLAAIAPHVGGKIVVDTTVPLMPPKVARVQLPEEGSAAARAARTLGPDVRLVTGFHNISAQKLREEGPVACDVLVFGDEVEARQAVVDFADRLGLRGLHGGVLDNSVAAEAMTSVLIAINKRYKVAEGAGVRVTGLDKGEGADG